MLPKASSSWVSQGTWRSIGGVAILCCATMAYFGDGTLGPETPLWFRLGYWSVFGLLFVTVFYMVLLDIRYIRLRYFRERQAIFEETLGEASFRGALRAVETGRAKDGAGMDGERGDG